MIRQPVLILEFPAPTAASVDKTSLDLWSCILARVRLGSCRRGRVVVLCARTLCRARHVKWVLSRLSR